MSVWYHPKYETLAICLNRHTLGPEACGTFEYDWFPEAIYRQLSRDWNNETACIYIGEFD